MKRKINTKGIAKNTSLAVPVTTDAEVSSPAYGPDNREPLELGKESDIISELGRELVEQGKVNVTRLFERKYPEHNLVVRPGALGYYTRGQYPPDLMVKGENVTDQLKRFAKGDSSFVGTDKDNPQILYNANYFDNLGDTREIVNHELRHAAIDYLEKKYYEFATNSSSNVLGLKMDGKGPYSFEEAFVDYIDFVKHQKAKKMFDEEGYQDITDAKEFESYEKKMERIGPENVKKLKNSYELISKLAEQELINLKNEEKPEYDDEEELRDASKEDLAPKSFMQKTLGALSDAVPQRKAQGGAIMAQTQRGQAPLPMTEAQADPQGGGPKAGNPATLMQPPDVPRPKAGPGNDPRDEAIQLVMQQSQKKDLAPTSDGTGEPMNLTNITPLAQRPQMPAPQKPELGSAEMPMMAKRGGTKEDKEGMSVVIGLGSSPMPKYEEASMGTPKDPPPGATADEVADDQHVLMSEGELVVPANVVRYHGLGTYEGLRREALMGLSEMENSGQINYDTGVKKAQSGLMVTDPYQAGNMPAGNMFRYPPIGINPPQPSLPGLAYTPTTDVNKLYAGNVGSYKDIINPPKEDEEEDGVEVPEVKTAPASLVQPQDKEGDATSPQNMAQAQADMNKSYDSAVAQAIAAGFTTPEEIALYIQGGNIKANTPLGSFGLPGFLFNNVERPDGTRPIDEAVKRYYQSDVAKARKEAPPEEISIDEALSKKAPGGEISIDKALAPGVITDAPSEEISIDEGLSKQTQKALEPQDDKPEVIKSKVQGTEVKVKDDKPLTITTGTDGKILGVNLDKEEKEEAQKEDKACVIATHGVANGGFSTMEKAKAEIWCERTYHGKWYGEAFRRGYRYLASKHVEQDTASQFYQEFKDFVSFGRGLKKGLKLRLNYYFRTVQFFITGLFVSKDI